MIINISASKDAYNSNLISKVGLVNGIIILADVLYKLRENGILEKMLTKGYENCSVEQWLVRDGSSLDV